MSIFYIVKDTILTNIEEIYKEEPLAELNLLQLKLNAAAKILLINIGIPNILLNNKNGTLITLALNLGITYNDILLETENLTNFIIETRVINY